MRLRNFVADSLPDAMQAVREQLGPDAVILSTEDDGRGGPVRITAALEDRPEESFDLASFAGGLQAIDEISDALDFHRVPPGLANRLMAAAADLSAESAAVALAAALDLECRFAPLPEQRPEKPAMLVGVPGAGKTATAAKLCARARLLGLDATLIAMDTVKAGGLDQVKSFAKALEVRLLQAHTPEALTKAVRQVPDGDLLIVDTVGSNPFDEAERAGQAEAAARIGAETVLVLPAGGDPVESADMAIAYAESGARSLIVTKTDTARRFGGLVSAGQASGLAVLGAGTSPHIGRGLTALNPVALARLLLPSSSPQSRPPFGGAAEPEVLP